MTGTPNGSDDDARTAWADRLLRYIDHGGLATGPARPCNYLPEQVAREQGFRADALPGALYHQLMERGFRRSGDVFYRMACPACRKCVPLRVPVATFTASRSQRRVLRQNQDVELRVARPRFAPDRWELYHRYLQFQHPGTPAADTPDSLRASLYAEVVDTLEATYWLGSRLVGVTILDACADSLSSVYHFFAPEESHRSLGVYSVLAEIGWAKDQGIPHYYLGFWIEGAETMAYKANYRPHELLGDSGWTPAP